MSSEAQPLVSIVIPAYNYAGYLDEAIQSVLNQDYPNVELIVLDDGSTDNTREVLERYAGRFYWETQTNMGQADTMNKGWRMAGGKILSYLNADDVLLHNAVSTSVEHLMANPDAILTYCNYDLIDSDSRKIRRVDAPEFDYREVVVKFVCPPGPAPFFLSSAFRKAGPLDNSLRLILDYEFWLRLGLHGRFVKIPKVLASFRIHGLSQTYAEADEKKSEEYVRVLSDFYQSQRVPAGLLGSKNEALSNAYIFAARSHFRSRRYAIGVSRLLKGLRLYPRNLSIRTARIVAHGLLTYVRHEILRGGAKRPSG